MPSNPKWHHRARVASLSRDRAPDDPELQGARRDLRAAVLADHVAKQVAKFPPLTDEQAEKIAALLTTSDGGGAR